jgi:hypothetical protein
MNEKNEWISIERLLSQINPISIPVLAEAIDKYSVQTIDLCDRRILATDGDSSDPQSKAYAIQQLANRHAMNNAHLSNVEIELFEENMNIFGSPLDKFGWPADCLPDFKKINPNAQSENSRISNSEIWTERSYEKFQEEYKNAGSYEKAAKIHGVSRQRYTEVFQAKKKAAEWGRL